MLDQLQPMKSALDISTKINIRDKGDTSRRRVLI